MSGGGLGAVRGETELSGTFLTPSQGTGKQAFTWRLLTPHALNQPLKRMLPVTVDRAAPALTDAWSTAVRA